MQFTLGVPLKWGFREKELNYYIHGEGLECKLTLLPVFHSNCIEIIDNGSLIKWLLLSFVNIE